MPSTPKQMRAAGMELDERRKGNRKQEPRGQETRPFGAASNSTLRSFSEWPNPEEQRRAARQEAGFRRAGLQRQKKGENSRAFGVAPDETVNFYATASDEEIRRRNGEIK